MKKLWTLLFCLWAFLTNAQSVSISSSASGSICPGTTVTFTASTSGITNPTYQWYKNGTAISDATNSTYSTNTLSSGDQIYVSVPTSVSGSLITSGLKFNFDAGNSSSYSGLGTTLTDLSGNGTHATFQNTPSFVSSPIKTFQWNSRGSNGSNSTKASFNNVLGDDMTVGAWIKTSSVGNDYAHYRLLYILTGEQGGGANDWGFGINSAGKLAFGAGPNDVTIASTTNVNTNEWIYVVATRAKSTGQIKLYINGVENSSGTGNANNTLNAQSSILIADGNDGPAYTFEGSIAIIEGYNAVLSADNILANFNANKGRFGITTNLNSSPITTTITNLSAPVTTTGDGCVNKTTLSTPAGLTSYAWYKDNAPISGAISNTYSPTTAGEYKVQVTSGTCSTMSAATTISVCGVTAEGKMISLAFPAPLVSTDGGANVGTGIDEQGKIHNTTGITTTKGTIGATTAIIGGIIGSTNGRSTSIGVVYSTDSNFGTSSTVTIQSNVAAGTYSSTLTGLTSVTTYFAKSFVVNKAGTSYGPVVSFTTSAPPAAVGDLFGGGIIYYILQPGDDGYDANVQHGLIAQPQNEEAYGAVTWTRVALNNNTISGAQYDGILKGSSNSAAIIANQGSGTYLFKYVSTLTINGYTDWYVPSIRELSLFRAFIFNPTYCTSGSGRYYWVSKANSNYKWTWGNYISSTQTGSFYKTNYVEGNSEGTTTYAKTQSGDNFVYVAIRSF